MGHCLMDPLEVKLWTDVFVGLKVKKLHLYNTIDVAELFLNKSINKKKYLFWEDKILAGYYLEDKVIFWVPIRTKDIN